MHPGGKKSQMSMLSSDALLTIWKSLGCRLSTINFVPYSDGHHNLRIEWSMHSGCVTRTEDSHNYDSTDKCCKSVLETSGYFYIIFIVHNNYTSLQHSF